MVRFARALMFTVLPAEMLLAVVLLAGVSLPMPLVIAAEALVTVVIVVEAVAGFRVWRQERRAGASRREAVGAILDQMLPAKVRRIMGFDAKGTVSIVLWLLRRRHGVPPGATALPYAREQATMLSIMLGVMVIEAVAVEVLLRALGVPAGLRAVVLVLDVYGIFIGLAIAAACATRPHVVTAQELRIRSGAFFDLRVPRSLIASVRLARNYNEPGMVTVADGRLGVAVAGQTNVVVELSEPVTAVRPLGATAEVRSIRFFTDTPAEAAAVLTPEKRTSDSIQ